MRPFCRTPTPQRSGPPLPGPAFGDYQTNALMALAKARKMNPRQLAAEVVARLDVAIGASRWRLPGRVF